jgi:hypothetical protein
MKYHLSLTLSLVLTSLCHGMKLGDPARERQVKSACNEVPATGQYVHRKKDVGT